MEVEPTASGPPRPARKRREPSQPKHPVCQGCGAEFVVTNRYMRSHCKRCSGWGVIGWGYVLAILGLIGLVVFGEQLGVFE